jgi:type II secretory ATPase GspE/PulE/Tfp pilus assembly ATPase PilB-like protein
MHPDTRRAVEEALSGAAGLLVIAGETASGRTTTLYRLLSWLRARGLAVESIEEYIDAPLPGVTQLAIDPAAGAGHAALLRSAMRRDPDIIGVDPIRDRESAGCAIQAGLCAYRVIATMRGSSAAGPLRRLLEVGIDPVLTAMAVAGVLVQRLARRVCVGCRLPGEPTAEERERLWLAPGQLIYRARPGGCVGCRGLGYLGRVGLFSFLPFDDELRRLFLASGPAALGRAARRRGLPTLLDDGVYKLLDGVTTPGELLESLLGAPGWEGEGG